MQNHVLENAEICWPQPLFAGLWGFFSAKTRWIYFSVRRIGSRLIVRRNGSSAVIPGKVVFALPLRRRVMSSHFYTLVLASCISQQFTARQLTVDPGTAFSSGREGQRWERGFFPLETESNVLALFCSSISFLYLRVGVHILGVDPGSLEERERESCVRERERDGERELCVREGGRERGTERERGGEREKGERERVLINT